MALSLGPRALPVIRWVSIRLISSRPKLISVGIALITVPTFLAGGYAGRIPFATRVILRRRVILCRVLRGIRPASSRAICASLPSRKNEMGQ
jgi:hypothetical protein